MPASAIGATLHKPDSTDTVRESEEDTAPGTKFPVGRGTAPESIDTNAAPYGGHEFRCDLAMS